MTRYGRSGLRVEQGGHWRRGFFFGLFSGLGAGALLLPWWWLRNEVLTRKRLEQLDRLEQEQLENIPVLTRETVAVVEVPAEGTAGSELAWKGTWERPMKVDESALDPLTASRMTDHNVRGGDEPVDEPQKQMSGKPRRSRDDTSRTRH